MGSGKRLEQERDADSEVEACPPLKHDKVLSILAIAVPFPEPLLNPRLS